MLQTNFAMKQPIELVVFDMAGTTVQDRHEVEMCFLEAASHTGLSVTPERVLALQAPLNLLR